MRVFVYWNFIKKLWSIRSMKTGRVIDRKSSLCLTDCILKVYEAGRLRVIREKRKNVHAGIIGYLIKNNKTTIPITYNPYKYDSFIRRDTKEPIYRASIVCMKPDGYCMVSI